MTIALITTSPYAIFGVFPDGTTQFRLPSGDLLQSAAVGWTGEGCALVEVAPFVVPNGQQIVGPPTYAIDGSGNVTVSYTTQTIPTPVPVSVSRRQYYQQGVVEGWYTQAQALALITTGTLPPSIVAFVSSLPANQQFAANLYLIGEPIYDRNNPLLNQLATAGGLSSAFMDAFFIAAALL